MENDMKINLENMVRDTAEEIRKGVRKEDVEKRLWQLEFDALCELYVRLICRKNEKRYLIQELLQKVSYEDLAVQMIWYSSPYTELELLRKISKTINKLIYDSLGNATLRRETT